MANGSSRVLAILISLVIGIGAGWLLRASTLPPPPPPPSPSPTATPVPLTPTPTPILGNHTIMVGPKAKDLTENTAAVSKSKGHKVRWLAMDPDLTLKIVFEVADFDPAANGEPPFKGQNGVPFVVMCLPDKFCKSGPINDKLKPDSTGKKEYDYKYYQYLLDASGNVVDQADGWIIVKG